MKALVLSKSSIPRRIALTLFVLTTVLIGTSLESQAQRFWRSNRSVSGFNSNSFRTVQPSTYRAKPSIPQPVTGYGANLHRNFIIRQQQQRSEAGGSLIYRGNVLWRR